MIGRHHLVVCLSNKYMLGFDKLNFIIRSKYVMCSSRFISFQIFLNCRKEGFGFDTIE